MCPSRRGAEKNMKRKTFRISRLREDSELNPESAFSEAQIVLPPQLAIKVEIENKIVRKTT
jgi:hypothetical protein